MSTRALYTFKGETTADSWNIYKHHDGYPSGAASVIQLTLDYFTWQLPRYEADTFAAGFCAAGKSSWMENGKFDEESFKNYGPGGDYRWCTGGGVRLMPQGDPRSVATTNCSDIEYRYEIFLDSKNELRVRAYTVNAWQEYSEELLVDCKQADFADWAHKFENEAA
jgi:hypothetical protein